MQDSPFFCRRRREDSIALDALAQLWLDGAYMYIYCSILGGIKVYTQNVFCATMLCQTFL